MAKKTDNTKPGMTKQRDYERRMSAVRFDVEEIPAVKNKKRRAACKLNLHKFLVEYFPESTGLSPFGDDQKKMIANMQECILGSGRQVNAIFRGGAKSSISEGAAIWAILYGHRKFVPIYGLNKNLSKAAIDSIKFELTENELLCGDFPEVCVLLRAIDNKPQRARSITYRGEHVYIQWLSDRIVFPTVKDCPASGGVIAAVPLSKSRGLRVKMPNGTQQRPDFAIIDDPQDDEIARNPEQIRKLLGWIRKGILRGGGHGKTISCVCNATVIERDDVVEHLLKDTAWQGERMSMVKAWPKTHDTHWMGQYAELRRSYDRTNPDDKRRAKKAATSFYRKNRKVMDDGAEVSWKHCFDKSEELSAIQHAYNILIDDGEEAFASECQNTPMERKNYAGILTPDVMSRKLNHRPAGEVPLAAQNITAAIDVHDLILYWVVCAWESDMAGYVLSYGTWPEQTRKTFLQRDPPRPLNKVYAGEVESVIQQGLADITGRLLSRDWPRVGGGSLKIERLFIDQGYKPGVVENVRRALGSAVIGSKGFGLGAANKPMESYQKKTGERYGHHWYMPNVSKTREYPHVVIDVNYWKSFVHERLALPDGSKGAMTLYGDDPNEHTMFCEHVAASEYWVETEGRGRKLHEWKVRPERPDNHWFDCLVAATVAANMCGCNVAGEIRRPVKKRRFRALKI